MKSKRPLKVVKDKKIKLIDLDTISDDDARLLHHFFLEYEQDPFATFFDKQTSYPFGAYDIQFTKPLIRYTKNQKEGSDRVEYGYSVLSEQLLGSGSGGEVYLALGKLDHAEDRMVFIKPTDIKSKYQICMMSVADIQLYDRADFKKIAKDKTPILIKDEKTNKVMVFGRKDNRWVLTQLDQTQFANVIFPEKDIQILYSNTDFDANIRNEIHKGHTRRSKAIKSIPIKIKEDVKAKNIRRESEIGRATGSVGTKKATFIIEGVVNKGMIVMDVEPGESLDKIIASNILTAEQRLILSIHLLIALQNYHDAGCIHRDIKPGNIMVDVNQGMEVRILDHGCSRKITEPDKKSRLTPLYVSPEMAADQDNAGIESDVYSMGRVLKELWGESEFLEEAKVNNPFFVPLKRHNEWINRENPSALVILKLDETVASEALTDQLAPILQKMNTVSPDERMKIKDGLSALYDIKQGDIKQENLHIESLIRLLGDGRNGNKHKEQIVKNFTFDMLKNTVSKMQNVEPHLVIRMFQDLFSMIQKNENNLYSNVGWMKETYTNTQLTHLQVLKDAYRYYLEKLNLITLSPNKLFLLYNQLVSDQDADKNPKNINNFNMNKVGRLFERQTNTHTLINEIIIKIEFEYKSKLKKTSAPTTIIKK